MNDETVLIPRHRSAAYPSYLIEECFDFVKSIYANFGSSTYVSREQIAKILGKAPSSILMKMSTSNQYNLIDMKQKDGYKATELFLRLYKPINDAEKKQAEIDCFKSPALYQALISEFEFGRLPNVNGLSVILFRKYGIAEAVAVKAAEIFLDNAIALNLIDSDGMFSFSKKAIIEEKHIEQIQHLKNDDIIIKENRSHEKTEIIETTRLNKKSYSIPLKGRRNVELIIPDDMKTEDFETLIKWVDLMKESFE